MKDFTNIPIIDLTNFQENATIRHQVATQIAEACQNFGFFYVIGHGVSEVLQENLEQYSRYFFGLSNEQKNEIRMSLGGRAWRGYFSVGEEMTSGKPDIKEGLYFGSELADNHPMVINQTPMFGKNLFPNQIPELKTAVLQYLSEMERLGHLLMAGISLSLGLPEDYFAQNYTTNPLILFRIFNYPSSNFDLDSFGVGEHTDYGLLTILRQDMNGGLEIKVKSEWIEAPPIKNSFVCNIGDMLDRVTKGLYLSTPHRVRNVSGKQRISFAFFFDPNFNSEVKPIDLPIGINDNQDSRWDGASVHTFTGKYGDYLLNKVAKVFPQLKREVM